MQRLFLYLALASFVLLLAGCPGDNQEEQPAPQQSSDDGGLAGFDDE